MWMHGEIITKGRGLGTLDPGGLKIAGFQRKERKEAKGAKRFPSSSFAST
jgi:hypothetical protein